MYSLLLSLGQSVINKNKKQFKENFVTVWCIQFPALLIFYCNCYYLFYESDSYLFYFGWYLNYFYNYYNNYVYNFIWIIFLYVLIWIIFVCSLIWIIFVCILIWIIFVCILIWIISFRTQPTFLTSCFYSTNNFLLIYFVQNDCSSFIINSIYI